MCTPSDANRDGMGSRAPIARLHSLPRALTGEVISNENQQDDCVPVFEPRLFGTAIPAFGVVAFAAPRMASFLDTLCDSSSASVAASCHFHSLHAHSCMRTAACAQPHAHSRMGTAAYTAECAQLHGTAACAQLHAHSCMRAAVQHPRCRRDLDRHTGDPGRAVRFTAFGCRSAA